MKLSLVPLSDKDAEKLKQALNTSSDFGKLVECIEAELEFSRIRVIDDLVGATVCGVQPDGDMKLRALNVFRLQSALTVLNELLEPDYKLATLDIDK